MVAVADALNNTVRCQHVRYEYDGAIRLTALVNENNAVYQFAYRASNHLPRCFSYNRGRHHTRVDEIGYGERAERPQRSTAFERDPIGRLVAKLNENARQAYKYDDGDQLLSIKRVPTATGKRLDTRKKRLPLPTTCYAAWSKQPRPRANWPTSTTP